ncbi:hypothetical protein [Streptomyces sp. NPDC056663]|uniref:hypothetical protein n=1 Tax=Streptomyces sp. NPDC056663 TaxID=3345899 RepID=UPI0036CA61BB
MSGPLRGPVSLLACTAGIALANNYAIQPALGDVARDTGTSAAAIGLVTTAALVGCIAGFAFLLPLADRAAPRRSSRASSRCSRAACSWPRPLGGCGCCSPRT